MANSTSVAQHPIRPARPASAAKPIAWGKYVLITVVLLYLSLLIFIPAVNVFVQAFNGGIEGIIETFKERAFQQAVKLTLITAAIAVPLNTIFGLSAAWVIARRQFPGRTFILSLIDLPFSISPVVAGLMIVLLYGSNGWFGPFLNSLGIKVVFALPAMVLATAFVSMPFVAREVIPVLDEVGFDQEEAAETLGARGWQVFWRVTIPSIRWGLLYGLLLTNARAMGEFGAVSVVSGGIVGKTQTLPLYVEHAYKQYETQASYTAASILACLAIVTLILKDILERKTRIKEVSE
jgi:sulfate/thiosulfate transport system permease protein